MAQNDYLVPPMWLSRESESLRLVETFNQELRVLTHLKKRSLPEYLKRFVSQLISHSVSHPKTFLPCACNTLAIYKSKIFSVSLSKFANAMSDYLVEVDTYLNPILSGRVWHSASHTVSAYVANTPVVRVGHPGDGGHGVVRAGYVVFEILLPKKIQHCNYYQMNNIF